MDWSEWETLVAKLNLGFPHRRVEPTTAREWYGRLKRHPYQAVERAYLRCLDDHDFLTCHALLDAMAADRRERAYGRPTGSPLPPRGVPMPQETRDAIGILNRSKQLPGTPGYLEPAVARLLADGLADELEERVGA